MWTTRVVAGMGKITGDRATSQASVIWEMVARCRVAMGSRTRRRASYLHLLDDIAFGDRRLLHRYLLRSGHKTAVRRAPT